MLALEGAMMFDWRQEPWLFVKYLSINKMIAFKHPIHLVDRVENYGCNRAS